MILLSRQKFNELVFQRDNYRCVWCEAPAVDAHHVLDRKLWTDGGYYLENGVSLCSPCHLLAEWGEIGVLDLIDINELTELLTSPDITCAGNPDKWGEEYPSMKYPSTPHFEWSESLQNEDRMIKSLDGFYFADLDFMRENPGKPYIFPEEVVVTEKMDGENTTMTPDIIHCRSVTPLAPHPSRNRMFQLYERIKSDIPSGFRICGENVYGKHSIAYTDLPAYFMVFSIWDGDICLSWDETTEWAELLGLQTVPVLYRGTFDPDILRGLYDPASYNRCEGYVCRVARSFKYHHFDEKVAKFVRKGHVQTSKHWMHEAVVPNEVVEGVYW